MNRGPGEVLLVPHDCPEMLIRGDLTTEEAAIVVSAYDPRLVAVGEAWVTWAHTGFYVNEDDEVCCGGVYYGDRFAGKRGSFRVTEIETRRLLDVDPYDARRALDGVS